MARSALAVFVAFLAGWGVGVDAIAAAQPTSGSASSAKNSTEARPQVVELLELAPRHKKQKALQLRHASNRTHLRHASNRTHKHGSAEQQIPLVTPTARELITIETLLCVVTALGGSFLVTSVWSWWSVKDGNVVADGGRGAGGERSFLLDNAKIMVQMFVIWGHFIYDGRSNVGASMPDSIHGQTWLQGAGGLGQQLMDMFAPFRMPLACFISGVCSQGAPSPKKIRRFVQNLVLPTCLWIFAVKPVIHRFLLRGKISDLDGSLHDFWHLQAWEGEWYLEALVLWRSSVFLFWSQLRPQVALAGMILVSCLCGYYNFGVGPARVFMIDSAIGFFPYFAVGYVFPFQEVERMMPRWTRERAVGAAVLALAWTGIMIPRLFPDPLPQGHCVYGLCRDADVMKVLPPWDVRLYWVRRAARLAVELPPAILVLLIVVPPFKTPLSWAGPYTLYPFLFHDLAHSWERELLAMFHPPIFTSTIAHLVVYLLHLPLGILYISCFGSSYWRRLFQWCMDPTWLHPLFADEEQKPLAAKPAPKEDKIEEAAAAAQVLKLPA